MKKFIIAVLICFFLPVRGLAQNPRPTTTVTVDLKQQASPPAAPAATYSRLFAETLGTIKFRLPDGTYGVWSSPGTGDNSERYGQESSAAGTNTVAVGKSAVADFNYSTAIGRGTETYSAHSTAIGYNAFAGSADCTGGTAVGSGAAAGAKDSVAIGRSAETEEDDASGGSIAIGKDATAYSGPSVAIGSGSVARNSNIAIGNGANSGDYTNVVVIGNIPTVTANNATVIGANAAASATDTTVMGYDAESQGVSGTAIGRAAFSGGAFGCTSVGAYSLTHAAGTAYGYDARSTGEQSVGVGIAAYATGNYAVSLGGGTRNAQTESIAIGFTATTTAANQLVIGSTDAQISTAYIGNGVTNAAPQNLIINGTGGSGTDIAGATVSLAGGRSTGSGVGGTVQIQVSPAGTSGTDLNALTPAVSVSSTGQTTLDSNVLGSPVLTLKSPATNDDPTEHHMQNRIAVTDATVTTLHTFTTTSDTVLSIEVTVVARRTGGTAGTAGDGARYTMWATFTNHGGTVTQIGTTDSVEHESQAAWDCALSISGSNVLLRFTGAADNNVTVHMTGKTMQVGS